MMQIEMKASNRLVACGIGLLLAAAGLVRPDAGQAAVDNPGTVTASITGGSFDVGTITGIGFQGGTITGALGADGTWNVPASGVQISPITTNTASAGTVHLEFEALSDATGHLDPVTGEASLSLSFRVHLGSSTYDNMIGKDCWIGAGDNPVVMPLSTAQGEPYGSGSVVLGASGFYVARMHNCGGPNTEDAGKTALGLDKNSGTAHMNLSFSPAPVGPGGVTGPGGGSGAGGKGGGSGVGPGGKGQTGPGSGGGANGGGANLNTVQGGTVRVASTQAVADAGHAWLALSCDADLGSKCSGTITLRRATGKAKDKKKTVARIKFKIAAGDTAWVKPKLTLTKKERARGHVVKLKLTGLSTAKTIKVLF